MDGGLSLLLFGNGDGAFVSQLPYQSGLLVPEDAKGLSFTDFDQDGWMDFFVATNNGPVKGFRSLGSLTGNRVLTVRLTGAIGNPQAVGARVTVHLDQGTSQTAEVQAGGAYLSQSTSSLTFGLGESAVTEYLDVVWPIGQISKGLPVGDVSEVSFEQPTPLETPGGQ